MEQKIIFAGPADEEELDGILTGTEMALAGEIEEHVVLRRGGRILAGARLFQADEDLFHLLVFAVAEEERGRGTGLGFLRELCARPWEYCLGAMAPVDGSWRITTIAKGEAAAFYERAGFRACDVSRLPAPFDGQCEACGDKEQCGPAPLVFWQTALGKEWRGGGEG